MHLVSEIWRQYFEIYPFSCGVLPPDEEGIIKASSGAANQKSYFKELFFAGKHTW